MSDDLKQRLRYGIIEHRKRWSGDTHADLGGSVDYDATTDMLHEAADRIAELEDKLDWVIVERAETFALMLDRAQTAEAKLTTALEVKLINAMYEIATYSNDPHLVKWARESLAELKGNTDAPE